jgi:hypothetical protein
MHFGKPFLQKREYFKENGQERNFAVAILDVSRARR